MEYKFVLTCRMSSRMMAILAATDLSKESCLEKFFRSILSAFMDVEKVEVTKCANS